MKKTKFNKKELRLFESIIDNRIKEQNKEMKTISKLVKEQEKYKASVDLREDRDVSITRNAEMLSSLRRRTKKRLAKLNGAKERIANKTYGICSKTGKMISKERLFVIPYATKRVKRKK